MNTTTTAGLALAALGIAAGSAAAQDQSLISFGFTNLIVEDFSDSTPDEITFFGSARSDFTFGGVSRSGYENNQPTTPSTQADFDLGTTGDPADPADAFFSLTVNTGVSLDDEPGFEASGSFTIVDADGDLLTMSFEGVAILINDQFEGLPVFLDALLTDIEFTAVGDDAGDGTFDGPSGGSFAYDSLIPVIPPFPSSSGDDFDGNAPTIQITLFDLNESLGGVAHAQGSFVTIPTPGAAGVLGLAGLAAARRRR